jgi:hypothetical protein
MSWQGMDLMSGWAIIEVPDLVIDMFLLIQLRISHIGILLGKKWVQKILQKLLITFWKLQAFKILLILATPKVQLKFLPVAH